MVQKHVSSKIKIEDISLSIVVGVTFLIYSFSGSTNPISMYISFAMLVLWAIVSILSNTKAFFKSITSKPMIFLYLHLLFLLMTAINIAGILQSVKLMGMALVVFSPLMIYDYYENFNIKKFKIILYASISAMIIFGIKALVFYSNHRDAARRLATDETAFGDIAIGGGYQFAFAATIFIVYLVELLINKVIIKKKNKVLVILLIIFLFYLVLETKSTLTIISLFFGIGLTILNKNPVKVINRKIIRTQKRGIRISRIFKIGLLIILTMIIIFNIHDIGRFILFNINGSDVVSQRLKEVGVVLANGLYESDYVVYRLDRPMFSMTKFIESPLIGQGYKYGYIYKDSLPYMGGHSEWLDALANYGMIGAFPFFSIFFIFFRRVKKEIGMIISTSYISTFILMGFLNPLVVFHTSFVVFLLIPIINKIIFKTIKC
ncbi:MAG: hypothetical protein FH751_07555 [Firmicutes bacterium]|nr:hypothetical protein [Bacillota bacterium]